MFTFLIIICCSITALTFGVLCTTLIIKLFRMIEERRCSRIRLQIEPIIDCIAAGAVETSALTSYIQTPPVEHIALHLFLERLELISGDEANRIISFIETFSCITGYVKQVSSKSAWKRVRAAVILGKTRSSTFIECLVPLLQDRHASVTTAAAAALAHIGLPASIPLLIRTIDKIDPKKAHLVVDCIIELCARNPAAGIPRIAELLRSSKNHLRYWGCVIMGELYSFESLPVIHTMVKDPFPPVRSAAVEALGKIGDPSSYEYVSLALLDPEWQVRLKAAWALGELKYPGAAPALSRALMDRQWEVNSQAVQSLIAIDTGRISFITLLDSDFPFIRWRAAESLEATGFMDKLIAELGTNISEGERNKKMDILRSCALNGARIPLYRNRNHANEDICRNVAHILSEIEINA